jgi:hypothetical protein
MPKLGDYLTPPDLIEPGKHKFTQTEVAVQEAEGNKQHPTVTIKGKIDDKGKTIFRYLHPNMGWQVAEELFALGVTKDTDLDLADAESVAAAYREFDGQTLDVSVKKRTYEGKEFNEFRIRGVSDGASSGRV